MQFGEHTQRAANYCTPLAEVALNLAVGDFERNGEIGGRDVEGGKRERVFEYHCVKTVKKNIKRYLKTMFEVRHGFEPVALLRASFF